MRNGLLTFRSPASSGRVIGAGLLALAAFVMADAARAESPSGEDLFKKGVEASKRGDDKQACEYFRESYQQSVTVGVLFKLGECEEKLGNVASAWEDYNRVIQLLDGKPEGAQSQRLLIAKKKVAALESKVPRLTVKLTPDAPPGTKVNCDGPKLEHTCLGKSQPLDPGKYTITVVAPEREKRSYSVELREGDRKSLSVEPADPVERSDRHSATNRANTPNNSLESRGSLIPAAISFGVAGLGIGVGTVTGLMAKAQIDDIQSRCYPGGRCLQADKAHADQAQSLITASWIGFIAGGIAALGGVTLVILRPGSTGSRPKEKGARLMLGPNSVQVVGRF